MSRRVRRCLQWYAAAWAGFGFATVIAVIDDVNADAVLIVIAVGIMSSTAPLAAVALIGHCRDRAAGASLLLSSAMPTFLWYPLNIVSLVCGTALLLTTRSPTNRSPTANHQPDSADPSKVRRKSVNR